MDKSDNGGWLRLTVLIVVAVITLAFTTGIGITTYYLTNPDALKPLLSRLTESFTGRKLEISGPLELKIASKPRITVRGLRFSNASWAQQPDMLTADYLSLQIDLAELLDGRIHILDFDAEGAVAYLEDQLEGEPNWNLQPASAEAESDEAEVSDYRLFIEGLALRNIDVWATFGGLESIRFRIEELIEASDALGNLTLIGNGGLNDESWRLKGVVGPLQELLDRGSIDIDMTLTAGRTDLSFKGTIADLANFAGLDLRLALTGPDATMFGELLDTPDVFHGDVALQASITPEGTGHKILLDGHLASFEVGASVTLADFNNPTSFEADLETRGPEIGVIGNVLGIDGFPGGPFTLKGTAKSSPSRLEIQNVRLETEFALLRAKADLPNLPGAQGAVAHLRLEGQDIRNLGSLIGMGNLNAAPYELTADLLADGAQASAALKVGGHTLTVQGTIGDAPGLAGTWLNLEAKGDDLAELTRQFKLDTPAGNYASSAELQLSAEGLSAKNIRFEHGPFVASGEFELPDLDRATHFQTTIRLETRGLASIGTFLSIDGFPDKSLNVEARLESIGGEYRLPALRAQVGNADVTLQGTLGDLSSLAGIDLMLSISAPAFDDLLPQPLSDQYGQVPVTLRSRLLGHEGAVEFSNLELASAKSRIGLEGRLQLSESLIGSYAIIEGTGPVLSSLLPPLGAYAPPSLPFRLAGRLDYPGERAIAVEGLEISLGRSVLKIDGIADLKGKVSTNLTASFRGDSLAELGLINGRSPPDIPFDISTRLQGSNTAIEFSSFDASWAESNLHASGSVDLTGKPRLLLTGSSNRMEAGALEDLWRSDEEAAAADVSSAKLIPDTPIPFDALNALDAEVALHIESYAGNYLNLRGVELKAELQDGALTIERLGYQDATGTFRVSGHLLPDNGSARLQMKLEAEDADLGLLLSPDQAKETIPLYSLNADLHGNGATIAAIAGSLDGNVLMWSEGGNIYNSALDLLIGDFLSKVIKTLNPFSKPTDPFLTMDCLVLNAKLQSGQLELSPGFVMRTDKVNMFVLGKVDLSREKLDLTLATQARQGIGVSASSIANPYFKVGGTFASPQLQLDASSAAFAYGIAAATGGLSILAKGVWDRVRGGHNPCPSFMPNSEATPPRSARFNR